MKGIRFMLGSRGLLQGLGVVLKVLGVFGAFGAVGIQMPGPRTFWELLQSTCGSQLQLCMLTKGCEKKTNCGYIYVGLWPCDSGFFHAES